MRRSVAQVAWSVGPCLSVCLSAVSVGDKREPCRSGRTDRDVVLETESQSPKEPRDKWRFQAGAGEGQRPLQIVTSPPPNSAVLLTHCRQLILRKISKFDATRCQILRLKCTEFDFRWGLRPIPRWGSLQRSPRLLSCI